ncbi:hypothetical protein FO519_008687, partial [Halicephalobus sp. NKZ332]
MASLLKVLIPAVFCFNLVVGQCPGGAASVGPTVAPTIPPAGSCSDIASNCVQNANLCTNA